MSLEKKIMNAFIGKVVRKDLAFLVKGGLPVPTYVLEYLLGQYCATDDQEAIEAGLEKVKQVIKNNYVHRAEAESVKGKIRENGKYRIIDKVTVTLNEKDDEYQAAFANLGLTRVPIGTQYVKANPKLLSGNGVWCIVTIGYISGEDIKVRWDIQTLKPVQISNVDLQEYIEQRQNFTTDEWIDFLMHTVGLNPEVMNRREKFITLARLLPHVENNFNFMELGPKGTGKSHVFQELSPYGVLVSGGDVTPARLFVKIQGNKEILGLVGYCHVADERGDKRYEYALTHCDPACARCDCHKSYYGSDGCSHGRRAAAQQAVEEHPRCHCCCGGGVGVEECRYCHSVGGKRRPSIETKPA